MGKYNLSVACQKQDFIWIAEYLAKKPLAEFDLVTGQEHWFKEIDREKLLSFGLYAPHTTLNFQVPSGEFFLLGRLINFSFQEGDVERHLTYCSGVRYNDIITYKDATATFNMVNPKERPKNNITQFNFGYKAQLLYPDGLKIGFKAIVHMPFGKPMYFTIRLVPNRELKGSLLYYRQGKVLDVFPAEFELDVAKEINITVR